MEDGERWLAFELIREKHFGANAANPPGKFLHHTEGCNRVALRVLIVACIYTNIGIFSCGPERPG